MAKVVQTLLAQGKDKGEAGRRAGWAALLTGKKLTRGTKGQLFERQHCRTALGGKVRASFCKIHDSGGLHQLGVGSYQLFS